MDGSITGEGIINFFRSQSATVVNPISDKYVLTVRNKKAI